MRVKTILAGGVLLSLMIAGNVSSQPDDSPPMNFFITSVGLGDGANLGGLEGADAHCQALAENVGRGDSTWVAYLSTQGSDAVNARDRIGNGPWYAAGGWPIARDQAHLHGDTHLKARAGNGLHAFHARTEEGELVMGVIRSSLGEGPNVHDILTGSRTDGRAFTDSQDHTCSNWTSGADGEGSAQVGHHDRIGFADNSWNSSHGSRGCSQENLAASGGGGLFYCFAID